MLQSGLGNDCLAATRKSPAYDLSVGTVDHKRHVTPAIAGSGCASYPLPNESVEKVWLILTEPRIPFSEARLRRRNRGICERRAGFFYRHNVPVGCGP